MTDITPYQNVLKDVKTGKALIKANEKSVLKACIAWLRQYGMQPIRNNTGTFSKTYTKKNGASHENYIHTGLVGSGDIICCARTGRHLEIETKSTDGKHRIEQKERQQHVQQLGGIYILARSLDDLEAHKRDILGNHV